MPQLFTNNATSTLAAGITNVATTLTVATGHGARFPAPILASDFFLVTLEKSDGTREIVKVTGRTGDVLSGITRAQEGTTAVAFSMGDTVELRATAGTLDAALRTSTNHGAADIATGEATSSTTYVDLATVGPSVTLETGTEAIIDLGATANRPGIGFSGFVSVGVSGATTIAATDAMSAVASSPNSGYNVNLARTVRVTGLTPGLNTFTLKYRCDGGGPWTFQNRSIAVRAPNTFASGSTVFANGAMREIATVTTSGGQSSVTFAGIPSTYRDLRVVISARSTVAATGVSLRARFNGDSGNNYDWMREGRFGVASGFAQSGAESLAIVGATSPASNFTHAEIDIPSYASTDRHKAFTTRGPIRQAAAVGNVFNESGQGWWLSQNAITQIELAPTSGAFVDGSVITLYGVGGAGASVSAVENQVRSATVSTEQSTSSTTFTDLATVGPSVSLVTGTEVLVTLGAYCYTNSAGPYAYLGVAVSGATTIAPTDTVSTRAPGDAYVIPLSRTFKISGLTPGLNTFTLKYRVSNSFHNFGNRDLTVQAL